MHSFVVMTLRCWPKAYELLERREALAAIGITDRIMHRRQATRRSPSWHKWMNVAITPL
jgi:hypothetical protein